MKVIAPAVPKLAKTTTTTTVAAPVTADAAKASAPAPAAGDKKSEYLQMLHKLEADVSGSDTSGKWLVR